MTEPEQEDSMLELLGIDVADEESAADAEPVDDGVPDTYVVPEQIAEVVAPPEFTALRSVLTRLVEQAAEVVPSRDFYPPLKNLVLEVEDGRLSITGSNSTATVVAHTTAVRIARPGRVLIGAHRFAQMVKRAAGVEIRINVVDQKLHIESGSWHGELRIAGEQSNYPPLPDLGDLEWTTVPRAALDQVFNGCRYAVGSDEARDFYMQVDIRDGVAVATDGTCSAQVSGSLPQELACSVSVTGVDLLARMLERNDAEECRIASSDYHLVAEVGPVEAPDRLIVAHLVNGFPQEARASIRVPQAENRDALDVDGDALVDALRRAAPTADEETSAVALRVSVDGVEVVTRNRYADGSSEAIPAKFVRLGSDNEPKARTVVLNHELLAKAVKAAQQAAPKVEGSEPPSAVRFLLGEDRSKSRPAFVLVCNGAPDGEPGAGAVQAVLSQVRSDWLH